MWQQDDLLHLITTPMPFGKYQGRLLIDLPEAYLLWFRQQGWPTGQLGEWLALALEIKINGLEDLIAPLREGRNQNLVMMTATERQQ